MQSNVSKREAKTGPALTQPGLLFFLQASIILTLILLLALLPSRLGPMVVIPLSASPIKPWIDAQRGATVLGLGRLPGSMIVSADRDALFAVAMAHHAILLPALPALCGQDYNQRKAG